MADKLGNNSAFIQGAVSSSVSAKSPHKRIENEHFMKSSAKSSGVKQATIGTINSSEA